MVYGKFLHGQEDLSLVKGIQNSVFCEELGLEAFAEIPDEFCMHVVAYDEGVPVGTGRIMFDGDRFTIAGIAVVKKRRRGLYGDFILRILVDKAIMSNAQEIYLDALEGTEGFFETVGFAVCGETFGKYNGRWTPMMLESGKIHKCCSCGH